MAKDKKNILIAYLPSRRDLKILQDKHWYRIPVKSKNTPNIVKDKSVELIAFYQPKAFKDEAHLIKYYGNVKSITKTRRKNLFKDEVLNPKSDEFYY